MRIGIDLGGTKIAGIAIGDNDKVLAVARVPTPRGDYSGSITAISAMVSELADTAKSDHYSVGIGMPGSVSPITGKVQNANSTWINDRHFQTDLETALNCNVRMANDANCLAVSEAYDGAGQAAASVFGVILGTGCGGGLVIDGTAVSGRHCIGGEWGHNPLPWAEGSELPGPACWCGRKGCLETWLSGPGLANDHYARTGIQLPAEEIDFNAAAGDKDAIATLSRHLDRCGRGLAHVINIFDPEVIVLGGGLSGLNGLVDRLPAAIAPYVFADAVSIRVEAAMHGPESGVRGAARLWPQ
ncbi:ROK family protein [Anderseniella sp. Alg231-50]|uniref:ROK family protein n=1 Tax=Anderseniella sp. Alg231-50 TaxID=1922226 RepID=UPI000D5528A3